jgi:hypothetical protein
MRTRRFLKFERVRWQETDHTETTQICHGVVLTQKADGRIEVLLLQRDTTPLSQPYEILLSARQTFDRNLEHDQQY